jgi:hypothetical protein
LAPVVIIEVIDLLKWQSKKVRLLNPVKSIVEKLEEEQFKV